MEIDPLYGQVFEVCPTPIVIAGEDGMIVKANRATNALFRIASPLAGRNLDELIPACPRLQEGKLHVSIGRILALSESLSIPADINISLMRIGSTRYFVLTIHDQSEKRLLLHELHERVKEKTTLLNVGETFSTGPVEDALRDCLETIRNGWQHPGQTAVRILLRDGRVMTTSNFVESDAVLRQELKCESGTYGTLEIYNLDRANDEPFLKEETALLEVLARKLAVCIELHLVRGQS